MSKLVIVESPAKAKTIGKYLGRDYVVKASMGHLRDLPRKKMSVDIENDFTPEYKPIEGKEKIIAELRHAAAESLDTWERGQRWGHWSFPRRSDRQILRRK